jgi:serine/threonine-protein kinase
VESLMGRIVDEFLEQLNGGEQPDIEDYARRYPQLATVLRQMLPALQVMHAPPADRAAPSDPSAAPAYLAGYLGDFRILREVGRGGMGVVYEAEQVSLGRHVALKVLPFAAALDAQQLQRFKNEAQAAAHLQHQHIVPVYAVGCERGVHFYAMQFIEGQSLAAVIAELRLQAGLEKAERKEVPTKPDGERPARREQPASQPVREGPPTTPYVPKPAAPAAPGETLPQVGLATGRSIRSTAYVRNVAHLGVQAAEALEHAQVVFWS